jgi:hypothetical protein
MFQVQRFKVSDSDLELGTLSFEPFQAGCRFKPIHVTTSTTAEITAIA